MNLSKMIAQVKNHPDADRIGMILCHNGVVRGSARDGRVVSGLRVRVDHQQLASVIDTHRKYPGIVDIRVDIVADRDLAVGEDVMFIVVAGDIREHVIAALTDTLNAVKSKVTRKTQFFI